MKAGISFHSIILLAYSLFAQNVLFSAELAGIEVYCFATQDEWDCLLGRAVSICILVSFMNSGCNIHIRNLLWPSSERSGTEGGGAARESVVVHVFTHFTSPMSKAKLLSFCAGSLSVLQERGSTLALTFLLHRSLHATGTTQVRAGN